MSAKMLLWFFMLCETEKPIKPRHYVVGAARLVSKEYSHVEEFSSSTF